MYIAVERMDPTQLVKQVFHFYVTETYGKLLGVRLNRWVKLSRLSKRHRTWSIVTEWSSNNFARSSNREAVKPSIPEDVRVEVIERLRNAIQFVD